MKLTEGEIVDRLPNYEMLVRKSADMWRWSIPEEYDIEDIRQELRMVVWKALRRWDPEHPKALPEEKHVFGALTNGITDLRRKGKRKRVDEVLTDTMPGEELPEGWESGSGMSLPRNGNGVTETAEREQFLNGLPETHQRMSMMIITGFSKKEIKSEIGLTDNDYREHLSTIKAHVAGKSVTYAACEIRMMSGWEKLVLIATATASAQVA